MPTQTIQALTDTFLYYPIGFNNYSTETYLRVRNNAKTRTILNFDLTGLPSGIIVTGATLSLYYYENSYGADPVGRTYMAKRVTEEGWVEGEENWYYYNYDGGGGDWWATAGGDFTTDDEASAVVPAVGNWISWDVGAQVAGRTTAYFIIMDSDETGSSFEGAFYSSDETVNLTLRPKLEIEYIVIADIPTDRPPKLYSGVKDSFFKDGWENRKYFFVQQTNPYPCVVQYWDLFVEVTNE